MLASEALIAEGLTFGIVAKSIDDGNFVTTWRGCQFEAGLSADRCLLIGNTGAAEARGQYAAIIKALDQEHFDALAISVTKSAFLARALSNIDIPLITFDSPFDKADSSLSRAYIGIDNYAFGERLAEVTARLWPEGGSLCIMTSLPDTNLKQRVLGVRRGLSGDAEFPSGQRLQGQSGWVEDPRCPWDAGDSVPRTMKELRISFSSPTPLAVVSVGWWPVVDTDAYRAMITPYRDRLSGRESILVVGVGEVTPAYEELMQEGVLHGWVSIDFFETGRRTAQVMRALIKGEAYDIQQLLPGEPRVAP